MNGNNNYNEINYQVILIKEEREVIHLSTTWSIGGVGGSMGGSVGLPFEDVVS